MLNHMQITMVTDSTVLSVPQNTGKIVIIMVPGMMENIIMIGMEMGYGQFSATKMMMVYQIKKIMKT